MLRGVDVRGRKHVRIDGVTRQCLQRQRSNKLQDFSVPQDSLEETFENKEQIEISRSYEKLPKPTLIATQEFLEGDLIYKGSNKDEALK